MEPPGFRPPLQPEYALRLESPQTELMEVLRPNPFRGSVANEICNLQPACCLFHQPLRLQTDTMPMASSAKGESERDAPVISAREVHVKHPNSQVAEAVALEEVSDRASIDQQDRS